MKSDLSEKFSWNPKMKQIINDNKVLLIVDSKWLIITFEIYQIIDEAIRKKHTVKRSGQTHEMLYYPFGKNIIF